MSRRLILNEVDFPATAAFERQCLMTFWTFYIDQIVKQSDAVVVRQHIKSCLAIWAGCDISGRSIQKLGFQGFNRLLEGKNLGLKFLNLLLEILWGDRTGFGKDILRV